MDTLEVLTKIVKFVEEIRDDEASKTQPTPTEMPDEEFLKQYATLGEEWWPTPDIILSDFTACRIVAFDFTMNNRPAWTEQRQLDSRSVLAALCESYCQNKLREEGRYVTSSGEGFLVEHYADKNWKWMAPNGELLASMYGAAYFPTHRHALLAAARAK